MAASNQSQSGFSYAQAAKGKAVAATSQTASSKAASGTATPATGTFSELAPSSNWADDVEANEGEKSVASSKTEPEQKDMKESKEVKDHGKIAPVRDIGIERTKSKSVAQDSSSGVSSPELAVASSTTTTDDSSSVPNGTTPSDTTWETKSQNSEPAWIAERKERQTTGHHEDGTSPAPATGSGSNKRGKKEAKEAKEPALAQPPQKPVVLHEAPPPQVNIWAKRLEDAKTKAVVPQVPKPGPPTTLTSHAKENARPKAEPRKKTTPTASVSRETDIHSLETKKTNGAQQKRSSNEPRTAVRQAGRPALESARGDPANAVTGRAAQREAPSLSHSTSMVPPPVKDETTWPTPENAQETERKAAAASEKESEETDADSGTAGKSRDKTKWTPLPVTPTIVWQTEEMNRPRNSTGERGGRGNTAARGRAAGPRGSLNGAKGGERGASKIAGAQGEAEQLSTGRARSGTVDREAMLQPAKPPITTTSREVNGSFSEAQSGAVAAKSPSKAEYDRQETKDLESSHHHTSHDIRLEDAREGSDAPRDAPTKKGSFETKEKSRPNHDGFGANGKEYSGRGKIRGGRGRGGSREYANGHPSTVSFANGHQEFGTAAFGVPASPSSFQSPRGNHAYGFAQSGRGGWARGGNPRSQSIPVEQVYGRSFGTASQAPSVQTYYPGMYEYPGAMPVAPVPFAPMMDPHYVVEMVSTQLEYYFSLDNLLKDVFLRKNMDSQGFVFLDVIANFNRLKQLTTDKDVIKFVSLKSESIEIRVGDDGKDRLRRRESWEQFVLPMDQREVGAQTEGPQALHRPEPVQPPFWSLHSMSAFRGPPAGGPQGPRGSHDSSFAMNGGVMQFAPMASVGDATYGAFVNGEEHRGRAAKSPIQDSHASPSILTLASSDMEPDVFPDERVPFLTVVVKMNRPRAVPHHNAASRTFSNGSIDTHSVFVGMDKEKPTEGESPPATNGEPLTNGEKSHAASPRHESPSLGRSPEKTGAASESIILWVKDNDVHQESLPPGADHEPYMQLRAKALDQRDQAATGTCPYDLEVLYQFWSHFLIRNFNNKMYSEFQLFANDDAEKRHSATGLQNLAQFYAKALASTNHPIRDHALKDYAQLVKNEPSILNGQAHKQLRQAWRNGALNLKIRKKLADILDDSIKLSLEA